MSLTEMFSVWDRQERPPEEGTAAGLQGFGVDKTFLSSLKGILLETELVTAVSPSLCPHLSHPSSLAQLCAGLLCSPFHRLPPQPPGFLSFRSQAYLLQLLAFKWLLLCLRELRSASFTARRKLDGKIPF